MRKTVNEVHIIGRLYSADLKEAVVQNTASTVYGKEYINGTINIATDDKGLNVVPITFAFVTSTTKSGKPNTTYSNLKRILEEDENIKTVAKDGIENATIVEVSRSALTIDDRYVVASKEFKTYTSNSGGFVTFKSPNDLPAAEEMRNSFDADMVITGFRRVPENPEREIKEHGIVHGAIFSFNESMLPIDFKVTSDSGMDYFEGLGVSNSNPIFTKVHGMIVNNRIVVETTEQTAFGAPIVTTTTKTTRDWIITSVIETPYEFGAENVLTAAELTAKMQDREVHLAKVKSDAEEYAASKGNSNPLGNGVPAATNPVAGAKPGAFKF